MATRVPGDRAGAAGPRRCAAPHLGGEIAGLLVQGRPLCHDAAGVDQLGLLHPPSPPIAAPHEPPAHHGGWAGGPHPPPHCPSVEPPVIATQGLAMLPSTTDEAACASVAAACRTSRGAAPYAASKPKPYGHLRPPAPSLPWHAADLGERVVAQVDGLGVRLGGVAAPRLAPQPLLGQRENLDLRPGGAHTPHRPLHPRPPPSPNPHFFPQRACSAARKNRGAFVGTKTPQPCHQRRTTAFSKERKKTMRGIIFSEHHPTKRAEQEAVAEQAG